jgi:D-alanyl-D-alanine-carboxypeptidase/D-alanyl-D-alanine-endopeptidase
MNKTISLIFITFWTFSTSVLYGQIKKESLDTLVGRLGENFIKNKQAVGLSIGVYNNGSTYFYNYGTIEREKTILPTQNTVYEIGSITKAFVSLILANAVIEKKVKLDDDIRKYLDGKYPNLEFKGKPVTLLELSNTTSGLPNWLPLLTKQISDAPPDSIPYYIEKIYKRYSQKDIFDALDKVVLDTVPGTKSAHSNGAALLLSYILEKVYNTSIENLVIEYILKPNKMNNTSFLASTSNSKFLAKGYNDVGKQMPYFATPFLRGVGGLNSTTSDLINFIKHQLDSTKVSVNLSHQNTFNTGWGNIGLSWQIYKWDNGNRQFWVTGGTYGFSSYVIFYPEINSGVVVLSNEADPSSSDRIGDVANGIFQFISKK